MAPRAALDQLGQSRPGDRVVVGQRAEVGRAAQAAVGKGVGGARAAPRRWKMEYLHSCCLIRMRETFYRTVLHGANTVNLGRGGPFISMFIVVEGGITRNVKKCLNSSRILINNKEFLYVRKKVRRATETA